jgi:CDGSH-type Zn-finger protein
MRGRRGGSYPLSHFYGHFPAAVGRELRRSDSRSTFYIFIDGGNCLMATIKVIQNGPYLVQGDDVTAVDWNGVSYAIAKRPFALCRCGASTTKPFCDGTHSRTGFKAAEAAVSGSQDKPANER